MIDSHISSSAKMQSALALSSPSPSPSPSPSAPLLMTKSLPASSNAFRFASIRSNALAVNYNSTVSVFPAEACETVGGDACMAEMCEEVKLKPEANKPSRMPSDSEPIEREYLDYADPRTVLLGEACDVLGGEFCDQ